MSTDDARPVPADRSGVDPIPIPREPDEEPDPGWVPGVDRISPDGTVARVPVGLAGTIFDPDGKIDHEPPPVDLRPLPPRQGGEVKRVLHRTTPGALVGGEAARPVLQPLPPGKPDIDPRTPAADDETKRILGWIRLFGLVGVGFVALMVWLAVRNGIRW